MCDFQKDVVRSLSQFGLAARVNVHGHIFVKTSVCEVMVSTYGMDKRIMAIAPFDYEIRGLKSAKYDEPKRGFSVFATVERIVEYCKKVEVMSGKGWRAVIEPPFRYDKEGGWITDKSGGPILEVRGYGLLSSRLGAAADDEQDAFAKWVASALNYEVAYASSEKKR